MHIEHNRCPDDIEFANTPPAEATNAGRLTIATLGVMQ